MSRPSRARGLKQLHGDGVGQKPEVAPFTGAWIEISLALLPVTNGSICSVGLLRTQSAGFIFLQV